MINTSNKYTVWSKPYTRSLLPPTFPPSPAPPPLRRSPHTSSPSPSPAPRRHTLLAHLRSEIHVLAAACLHSSTSILCARSPPRPLPYPSLPPGHPSLVLRDASLKSAAGPLQRAPRRTGWSCCSQSYVAPPRVSGKPAPRVAAGRISARNWLRGGHDSSWASVPWACALLVAEPSLICPGHDSCKVQEVVPACRCECSTVAALAVAPQSICKEVHTSASVVCRLMFIDDNLQGPREGMPCFHCWIGLCAMVHCF
ncbi:uncharacterized protein LOC112880976 [Panicum hallii]|uniref:uncharacterized protein LOC112880976 n=1 Tax=Panicum hallii TaxID=206008 RepID=UPI000DF4D28E|nr:uncharacterized protein LOC112880976 [Panicum hallii]